MQTFSIKNFLTIGTVFLGSTALIAGCGSDQKNEAGDDYRVALVLPYSGDMGGRGKAYENAIAMAVDDLMNAGFRDATGRGFSFTLISSGNGADAVREQLGAEFDKHRNDDGTTDFTVVISSTGAAQLGSTEISGLNKVPHFETAFGAHYHEFIHVGHDPEMESYIFSARPLCLPEAVVTADFIAANYPGKTLALFRGHHTHDILHTKYIRQRLAQVEWDGTILMSEDEVLDDPTFGKVEGDFILDGGNYSEKIAYVINTYNPDVVFMHLETDGQILTFLQDMNRQNFEGDIVTCGMFRNDRIIDNDANVGISDFLEDRLFFTMRAPIPSPDLDEFNARYNAKFPSFRADTFTAANYDAMILAGLAAVKANPARTAEPIRDALFEVSVGGAKYGYNDLEALITAIAAGEEVDYDGPSGYFDIDENRMIPGSYFMEQVVSDGAGKLRYLELTEPVGRVTRVWDEE